MQIATLAAGDIHRMPMIATPQTRVRKDAATHSFAGGRFKTAALFAAFALVGILALALAQTLAARSNGKLRPGSAGQASAATTIAPVLQTTREALLVPIPARIVTIGDNLGPASERPAFSYSGKLFYLDRTPVTVRQFAAFVAETGYRTDAERFGSAGVLDESAGSWMALQGATWKRPHGHGSPPAHMDHPVTQVSWNDANAFCKAYGLRLPTEFEWEQAARMGQTPDGHVFHLDDSTVHGHTYLINAWQGIFPVENTAADGYRTTSPVGAFGVAPSGLTDMAGNVWEWTSSWYLPYGTSQNQTQASGAERVSRGGSFLCSQSFCQGYRASARNHATPDTSLENVGFRCAGSPNEVTHIAGQVQSQPALRPTVARR